MKSTASNRSPPAAKRTPKKGAASAKATTSKKGSSPVRAATPKKGHPAFVTMICKAIADIEGTVSRMAIAKWIKDRYDVNESTFSTHFKSGLAKAEEEGRIVKIKASYKLKAPKKTKEETPTTKTKAGKRKGTTPKTKKAVKKRRTEKESEGEEIEEEEEEELSQEVESQEGTAEEGSQAESDVGPIEDITADQPAKAEAESKAESVDETPGKPHTKAAEEAPDLQTESAREGPEMMQTEPVEQGQQPPLEQAKSTVPVEETVERDDEVASLEDKAQIQPVPESEEEPKEAHEGIGEPSMEVGDEPSAVANEPKVSEVETPTDEGVSEVPVSKLGEGEVVAEATEQDADAPVITSVPVVQEADGDHGKTAPIPAADDLMVTETV